MTDLSTKNPIAQIRLGKTNRIELRFPRQRFTINGSLRERRFGAHTMEVSQVPGDKSTSLTPTYLHLHLTSVTADLQKAFKGCVHIEAKHTVIPSLPVREVNKM